MVISSYVRSTDRHGKPCRQNVSTCVKVAVDTCGITTGTVPTANSQRKFIDYKPASHTSLTTRVEAVYLDQSSPVPLALILKLTKHLSPSCIANTTSQLAVTNHISNGEVFDSYEAIFSNQTGSQLMQKVSPSIFNFGVYPGYFKSRLMSVVRVFGFPTQFLLRHLKFLVQPIKMLWVSYLVAIASTEKTSYSRIQPDIFICRWKYFYGIVLNQQRDKPSARV